jgi:alpha-tubulin suppressor-like RCC1 family protein
MGVGVKAFKPKAVPKIFGNWAKGACCSIFFAGTLVLSNAQIPGSLVAKQSGPNGFVATWGVVTGATGYELQVSTEPSFTSGLIGGDRPVSLGTTTSLGITGISGQIRYYRVRSVFPSLGEPVKTAWSPAVSAPDLTAFGKYATLNATGNADSFQAAVGSSANNNSYTISFWMRPDRLGGVSGSENVQVFRQPINNNASAANVDIDLLPDGSLVFGQRSEAGEEHFVSTPADAVLPGNWVHVTAVRDAANAALRLYINGVEIAAKTLAFGTNTWNIVNSGGPGATQAALNNDSNANRIRAAFDDVRIYRAVRTPAQILEGMSMPLNKIDANSTANTSLVFYAPLEGTSLSSTDANSFYKGTLNGSGSGTITSQSVLTEPILSWEPSPINLNAPAVLSTNELTASAEAPTGGSVAGLWSYSPAAGTSLSVGTNVVVGTFVPTDLNSYSIGTITNQIVVASSLFTYTNNGTGLTITGYTGAGGNVVIPATIGGVAVTGIGNEAFKNITSITNLTLPNSLTAIGQKAFEGCTQVISISIPNSVATIGQFAFSGCSSLMSITLPTSLTLLDNYLFAGCGALSEIVIPNGVTTIGSNAFESCANLVSATLPSSVTLIKSGAFFNCPKLAAITIPSAVATIEGNAFFNSSTLASVYFQRNTAPTIGANAFTGIATQAVGYYPATASAAWQGVTISGLTLTPFGQVNRAPVILSRFSVGFNEDGTSTTGWTGVGANDTYGPDKPSFSNSVLVATATGSSSLGSAPLTAGTYTVQFAHGLPFPNAAPGTLTVSAQAVADGSSATLSTLGTSEVVTLRADTTWTNDSFTFTIPNGDPAIGKYLKLTFNHSVENVWHGIDSVRVFISGSSTLGIPGLTEDVTGNLLFSGTPFFDVDGSSLTVTLSVDAGTITGNPGTGITVGGTGTARTFAGTVADLNAYFITAGKITYLAPQDFNGSKTLGILVSDGELTANGSATINVQPGNDAPILAGQSTTYDALAEFVAGPASQSANSRWQYLGGNVSALTLLGNWKTAGNEIIQNQPQWDGNSGYLSNYPFVQRVNSATGPTSANTLVIHPSNLEEVNRAVAIGWKNTSGQTVAANFNVNLRLPYGSANGIDYKLQRGLAGSSRYLSIRSGSLQAGGSVALASDALLEMQTGEMLYLIVDSKNIFDYDHTEVSAFTVTVAGGANLDSISQGTVPASNPGTAVTVLTATSSDDDTSALKGIAITGVDTSHGIWEYTLNGGSVWNSLSGVNIASARLLKSDELHRVRFIPNASFSGNAEIQYRAWDQTSGEDGALADLTVAGGGAWVLVAYGANASLGGFLTGPSGSFSSSARTGSAVLPGSLDILKNSMELAMTWTASGGSLPSGGVGSYTHGIAFELPNPAGMNFDGSASSPLIYNNGANPLNSSFAVGSSNPDQSLVDVRTLVGSPGMPSQMYLRNKTFGAGYGGVYGLVMNDGSNAQLDYSQVPDSQTFKAVYLDHGAGAAQGQGLVMGGSGGASNSYVPSTMALWARLDPLQVLALSGGNPISSSGNYLLDGVSTSYVDLIDFDASGAFSAETATGTIQVLDTSVPVITLIGANPLEIYKGATFSDPGATVTDNADATRTIAGTGEVNTATVGNYTLNYNATDAAGNPAVQMTRTVNVVLDPAGDEDGDGVTNGAESSAGTNPLVKNILRFQTIDMLALGKGNFSIAESNGGGGAPVGFRYGTPAYYGGVPFFITDQSNQVWHAARAPGGNGTGVVSETFPIAVNNVYGFYTLAGLWWGVAGSYVTYTFNFSDGSSYSKGLINNVDLRDYNIPSSFANSINGTTTQNVFFSGNYHLDRQWIDFAAAGHGGKNLVSFTVTDRGASGSSRIFLAAATAQVGAPGQIPPGATDTDGDGILDSYELGLPLSTKPEDADTDDDGLSDGTEISGTTDPLVADVDNDGLKDGVEFAIGTNPLVADSDGDGTSDGDEDADNDGGSNRIEVGLGNSPTVANVYNRLINGSFEGGTEKPAPGGFLAVPQNDVPGWKTTANNNFTIELWGAGFTPGGSGGSSGGDGNVLAELNYIASGTLYQDVIMTVGTTVSYSFLHRGRSGTETIEFRIDRLVGGPGSAVEANFFNRQVSTGNGAWVRYRGTPAVTVQAGKTYRFSYSSITPDGGSGNLLDGASFEIDQDADGLTDSVETNTGTYVSANNTGTNPSNPDSDNDGYTDGVEVEAGSSPNSADDTPVPEIVADPVGATKEFGQSYRFEVLASGMGLTYQWKRDGQNVIGGSNPYLELASLTVSDSGSYAVTVSNSYGSVTSSPVYLSVTQALISSGFSHSLYLATGAATVTAWGLNTDGRLGVGDMNSPVNWAKTVQGIPVGVTVDALSAGGTHSLILAGGQVYAAGSDRFGQLGQGAVNGANKTSFTPVVVPSSTPVAVAAGGNHSLIVTASGKVFAFGDNTYGQLAQPATTASSGTFIEVNFPGLSTKIVSVAAGADHNLAVDEGGGVWVWGRNDSGQLGKNTRTSADRTPVRILSSGAKSLAAGYAHSLILKQDGSVLGFGRNTLGQTGQSSGTSYAKLPIPIPGLSGIRLISAGTDSSFAIDSVGQLRSWGYNAYGELLLGNASPSSSPAVYGPTPSPIATNVFNVSGGGYSSLAVGAQGVIFGGRNDVGQSGNGPDPEQVVGDYNYIVGDLGLGNLTMDLAGTTETLYDQIFIGNGAATLNGILNLMFVGTYSGPVYGSTQTFDLIWAKNGITVGTGYQLAFNQAGYLVESAVVDKSVEGVSGKVLQATIRAVVTAADLAKAVDLARPSLDGVESVSYGGSTGVEIRTLSVSHGVEMIYSYERPTGGVISGAEYFVDGKTYRVQQGSSVNGPWANASVSGTTVTPLGNGRERVTLRISSSGDAGFLKLEVAQEENNPQAPIINPVVGNPITN